MVIGLVISLSPGIVHPYYTVAMAPSLGALVGISATGLWRRRRWLAARVGLAGGLGATVVWSYVLLGRTPDWFPVLRPFVAVVGTLGVFAILALPLLRTAPQARRQPRGRGRTHAALAAPLFSTVATAATPQSGLIPVVTPDGSEGLSAVAGSGLRISWLAAGRVDAPSGPVGNLGGVKATKALCIEAGQTWASNGALLDARPNNPALTKLLQADADRYAWVAATVGSINAAGYQIGHPGSGDGDRRLP